MSTETESLFSPNSVPPLRLREVGGVTMSLDSKPILILGIGNILLKDEGVGVHTAKRMMEMDLPPDIEVMDGGPWVEPPVSYRGAKKSDRHRYSVGR